MTHLLFAGLASLIALVVFGFIVIKFHNKLVEDEIWNLKCNSTLTKARHHSYIPIFVTVTLDKQKYDTFDFDEEARATVRRCLGKVQNRVDRVLWWSDFSKAEFDSVVEKLEKSCKTSAAKRYLKSLKPSNFAVIVVTKDLEGDDVQQSKSYTATMVQQMIEDLNKVKPERYTSISPSLRYKVIKADNFTCVKCGRSGLDVELHVLPENGRLVTVCKDCAEKLK